MTGPANAAEIVLVVNVSVGEIGWNVRIAEKNIVAAVGIAAIMTGALRDNVAASVGTPQETMSGAEANVALAMTTRVAQPAMMTGAVQRVTASAATTPADRSAKEIPVSAMRTIQAAGTAHAMEDAMRTGMAIVTAAMGLATVKGTGAMLIEAARSVLVMTAAATGRAMATETEDVTAIVTGAETDVAMVIVMAEEISVIPIGEVLAVLIMMGDVTDGVTPAAITSAVMAPIAILRCGMAEDIIATATAPVMVTAIGAPVTTGSTITADMIPLAGSM